jgi:ribosomal protein S13
MLYDCVSPDKPDENTVEAVRKAYVAGESDEAELERRVETLIDSETERIRAAVTPVQGIGPELSVAVARELDSLEELRSADREGLEAVDEVGQSGQTRFKSGLSRNTCTDRNGRQANPSAPVVRCVTDSPF